MAVAKTKAKKGFRRAGKQAQMIPTLASTNVHIPRGTKAPAFGSTITQSSLDISKYSQVMSALFASDALTATTRRILVSVTLARRQLVYVHTARQTYKPPKVKANIRPTRSLMGSCSFATVQMGRAKMATSVRILIIP